jgi:hypothetical protein
MKKEKITLTEAEIKKNRRDLMDWKVRASRAKLNININEKMIDSKFPTRQLQDEMNSKVFQMEALSMDVEFLEKEIKEEAKLNEQRMKLRSEQGQLEIIEQNIKVLEKQLKDGHFVDVNTGDFAYKYVPEEVKK